MGTIFVDVDTQLDFAFPAGALYAPGADRVTPTITRLVQHASARGIQVISTADAHIENDPEFRVWPPHCVAGTTGQTKVGGTLLANHAVLETDSDAFARKEETLCQARQVVVEKQAIDPFSNRNLLPLLKRLQPATFVVFGLVTEYCVRASALGLLEFSNDVLLVADAICSLEENAGTAFIDRFVSQGGKLVTSAELLGTS